jgi:hypothetical protein
MGGWMDGSKSRLSIAYSNLETGLYRSCLNNNANFSKVFIPKNMLKKFTHQSHNASLFNTASIYL